MMNQVENFVSKNDTGLELIPKDLLETHNIIGGVHDQVQLVMENKNITSYVLGIADKIDDNMAMVKLRMFWNYMPNAVRWCIMHVPNSVPALFLHTTKQLVYCGFLPYRDDPAENEDYTKNSEKYQKMFLEWSIKIGKYFLPELEAVDLLLGPIGKIIDVQDNLRGEIRHHLSQKRHIEERIKITNEIKTKPVVSALKTKYKIPAGNKTAPQKKDRDDDFITEIN